MGGGGFEPPKQFAADLQSVPFGHSGIHPFIAFWQLLALSKKPMIGLEPVTDRLWADSSNHCAKSPYRTFLLTF